MVFYLYFNYLEDGSVDGPYPFESLKDTTNTIIEEYRKSNLCMSKFLSQVEIDGISLEESVQLYAECMYLADKELIVHFCEGKPKVLGVEQDNKPQIVEHHMTRYQCEAKFQDDPYCHDDCYPQNEEGDYCCSNAFWSSDYHDLCPDCGKIHLEDMLSQVKEATFYSID